MPEIDYRYACPVCLGVTMEKLTLGQSGDLILDHCTRCGGIWFDFGEVQKLRHQQAQVLANKIELGKAGHTMQCHSCHRFMGRDDVHCSHCGWENVVDCPVCSAAMKIQMVDDLRLDFCRACKGVWFDNIELAEIWNGEVVLLTDRSAAKRKDPAGGVVMSSFAEALTYDPTIAFYGGQAAIDAGSSLVEGSAEMVSHVPEVAGAVVEGTADMAGAVFEAIAEIVAGIFSGL